MRFQILARPAAEIAQVDFDPGDTLTCDVGAMVAMTTRLTVKTTTTTKGGGGLLRTIKRMVGGEKLSFNHFTARAANQRLFLGPGMPGDVIHHRLQGTLIVQGGSWLASTTGVAIDATSQGGTGLFSGEGLILLQASGVGDRFFKSYGSVFDPPMDGSYIIDTGYIVAFEETLSYRVRTVPGLGTGSRLKTFFFGANGSWWSSPGAAASGSRPRQSAPGCGFYGRYRPTSR